jgi:hypothetical protein
VPEIRRRFDYIMDLMHPQESAYRLEEFWVKHLELFVEGQRHKIKPTLTYHPIIEYIAEIEL